MLLLMVRRRGGGRGCRRPLRNVAVFFILRRRQRRYQSHYQTHCKFISNEALCPVRITMREVDEYPKENVQTFRCFETKKTTFISFTFFRKWSYRLPELIVDDTDRRKIMSEQTPTATKPSTNQSSLALSRSVVEDDWARRYISSSWR